MLVALGLTCEAWVNLSPSPSQALVPGRRHPGSAWDHRSRHAMPSTQTRGVAVSARVRSAAATPVDAPDVPGAEDAEGLSDLAEVTSIESADQSALAQRLQGDEVCEVVDPVHYSQRLAMTPYDLYGPRPFHGLLVVSSSSFWQLQLAPSDSH